MAPHGAPAAGARLRQPSAACSPAASRSRDTVLDLHAGARSPAAPARGVHPLGARPGRRRLGVVPRRRRLHRPCRDRAAGRPRRLRPAGHGADPWHERRASSPPPTTRLAMADGEFVVLLDHDDQLTPDALSVVDEALRADPEIDYLYSDEDKIADDGSVYDTFYKPDWSPERLRSQNYCTHLSVLRRVAGRRGRWLPAWLRRQPGPRPDPARVSERARRIHHVPRVLYHWCVNPGSAAADPHAKPYAREAGRRAVADHLDRLGVPATVEHLDTPGHFRVRRQLAGAAEGEHRDPDRRHVADGVGARPAARLPVRRVAVRRHRLSRLRGDRRRRSRHADRGDRRPVDHAGYGSSRPTGRSTSRRGSTSAPRMPRAASC